MASSTLRTGQAARDGARVTRRIHACCNVGKEQAFASYPDPGALVDLGTKLQYGILLRSMPNIPYILPRFTFQD